MSKAANPWLPLWPVRYKPLADELLSSWLIRLSHGMGLKVQTFCNLEFGNQRQVWNRDIDRFGPSWLIERLSQRTGTPLEVAHRASLRAYDGILYRRFKSNGVLPWVLRLKMYHRTWLGHGLMFCPGCLAEDKEPYFRRRWRLALNTVCPRHRCMLLDCCPACQAGVGFTRTDLGQPGQEDFMGQNVCHACGFDLRQAVAPPPGCLDEEAAAWLNQLWTEFEAGDFVPDLIEQLTVFHMICSLLTRRNRALHLAEYLGDRLGVEHPLTLQSWTPLETRSVDERHQLLQMAAWLMVDLPGRLGEARRAHAIRFNHLLRDFDEVPEGYRRIALSLQGGKAPAGEGFGAEHGREEHQDHDRLT